MAQKVAISSATVVPLLIAAVIFAAITPGLSTPVLSSSSAINGHIVAESGRLDDDQLAFGTAEGEDYNHITSVGNQNKLTSSDDEASSGSEIRSKTEAGSGQPGDEDELLGNSEEDYSDPPVAGGGTHVNPSLGTVADEQEDLPVTPSGTNVNNSTKNTNVTEDPGSLGDQVYSTVLSVVGGLASTVAIVAASYWIFKRCTRAGVHLPGFMRLGQVRPECGTFTPIMADQQGKYGGDEKETTMV